jgi:putative FmdB family regulatory protein
MPIYEYQCQKCDHNFEQLQKITDKPPTTCPKCHARQLVKLVSNTSFQLKGTGWYVTDFKDKKIKKEKDTTNTTITETKDKTKTKPSEKTKTDN